MNDYDSTDDMDVITADPDIKDEDDLKEPPKYVVVLHNDDFTPMDFVVEMLKTYFGHSEETATIIMLDVHQKGKGIAGVYTKDIAETKAAMVGLKAQAAEHPLKVTFEPE